MIFSDKKIAFLLMNKTEQEALIRANSEVYFGGCFTENMHLCEKTRKGMQSLCYEVGETNPLLVLRTIQEVDDCLKLESEMIDKYDTGISEKTLREFADKMENAAKNLRELNVYDKHETYLVEHLERIEKLINLD